MRSMDSNTIQYVSDISMPIDVAVAWTLQGLWPCHLLRMTAEEKPQDILQIINTAFQSHRINVHGTIKNLTREYSLPGVTNMSTP